MKKLLVLLLVLSLSITAFAGCNKDDDKTPDSTPDAVETPDTDEPVDTDEVDVDESMLKLIVGYMVIKDNLLYLDEVEIITGEDEKRIEELDAHNNMPGGYYIYNADMEIQTFELTNETTYTFVDYNLLFVKNEDGDRLYTATKIEEFILHLDNSYYDTPPGQKVPFFIEVKEGKVIGITEKYEFTI